MRITFLIGNGFDLNAGLKTRYTDFYDHILKTKKTEGNIIYKEIEKDKKNKFKDWSDFEKKRGNLTYEIGKSIEYEDFIKSTIEIRKHLTEYLLKEEEKNKLKFNETSIKASYPYTLTNFFSEVNRVFHKNFNEDVFVNSSYEIELLNFNYTDTLNTYFAELDNNNKEFLGIKNIDISYVHGKLDSSTGIYFGVNDESQINHRIFDKSELKAFIKPYTIDEFNSGEFNRLKHVINNSQCIVIFGMSFGESDNDWWETIAKSLKKRDYVYLFLHHYEKDLKLTQDPYLIINKKEDIQDKFIKKIEKYFDENEIDFIRKKIFVILNSTKMFKMN